MTTAEAIGLAFTVLAFAAGYGGLTARVKRLEADVHELAQSLDALRNTLLEVLERRRKDDR